MNQHTLFAIGKACNADHPNSVETEPSLAGIPILIREGMMDNKVGICTYNALGILTRYEVIEAFK
jgi:hypothetical protein